MLGAIAGDIIGSIYEGHPYRRKDFPLFDPRCRITDDTVLTVAVADCLLSDGDYTKKIVEYANRYPHAGYGGTFRQWFRSEAPRPYNSWGNGSAMRVSPVGWARATVEEVLEEARRSAEVTHNHPEGVKGAQAVALAVFLARTGEPREMIRSQMVERFGYMMNRTVEQIRPHYRFDISCQGSVPESIICFLDSTDFEDAIRNAVSLGGDADTMACIAGAIAEAFYGSIPALIEEGVMERLPEDLAGVVERFSRAYRR